MSSSSNRDSNGIRASIFDACVELGALDDNGTIAEWMFNEPLSGARTLSARKRQSGTTRFREVISTSWEEPSREQIPRQRKVPFSLKASAFAARFRPKGKVKPSVAIRDDDRRQPNPAQASLSRRSFFQRSIHKPDVSNPDQGRHGMPTLVEDNVFVSTDPQPPPQPKSILITHPEESVPKDDGDDEWEEVEANPQSPLYALNNKGLNPLPASLSPKKTSSTAEQSVETDTDTEVSIKDANHNTLAFAIPRIFGRASGSPSTGRTPPRSSKMLPTPSPSPSPNRTRKPLSIRTKTKQHRRGISTSLPNSPFVLLTSNSDSTMPQPTSRIVFPEDTAAIAHTPVDPASLSKSQRTSMGYHNQFFAAPGPSRRRPKSVSVPSRPPGRPLMAGGPSVPFPTMKN